MKAKSPHLLLPVLVGMSLAAPAALAQVDAVVATAVDNTFASFRIAPSSILNENTPLFSIARNVEAKDFQGAVVEDALNFNLGVQLSPISGLNVRADAWRLEVDDVPAVTASSNEWQGGLPQLFMEDSSINEFNLNKPGKNSGIVFFAFVIAIPAKGPNIGRKIVNLKYRFSPSIKNLKGFYLFNALFIGKDHK